MKSRTIVLAVVLLALFAVSSAPAQTAPLYIKQFGSDNYDYAMKTVTDSDGNVYVAGMTMGAFSAPPPATPNTNSGSTDIFVAKFDPSGTLLWVSQFGSSTEDNIGGIALGSPSGFLTLYVTGWTKGVMPGGTQGWRNANAGTEGTTDIFVAKIHPASGTVNWIKQYGTPGNDFANGIATDLSSMIYLAGSTTGTFGSADTRSTPEAFLMRLNADGDRMGWAYQFNVASNPTGTAAYAVAVESASSFSNVFVTGLVSGNLQGSLFVAKFSYDFELLATVTLGGPNRGSDKDQGLAIAVDRSRNVIVAGSTQGNFEGSTSSGADDIILAKFDRNLALLWTHQYGTEGHETAHGVAVDAEGSIYVTGVTEASASGRGLDGQTPLGGSDIFLSRLAPEDGRRVYTRLIGTAALDWGYGITLDSAGAIYVAALTAGALGTQPLGLWDAVLIKFGPDGPVPRPVTEFFINGTVQELPLGSGLEGVSITVKDELGQVLGDYTTDSAGRFASKVTKAGRYFIHKLKLGYRAQVDPDVVEVTQSVPSAAPVAYMEKVVVPTSIAFRKGYNTVRFEKLPTGDRSVDAVFGPYAGNPHVGLIFSFDKPMQFLILAKPRTAGNLRTMEFNRSYMIYTSRAFTIDTTSWVSQETVPATALPKTRYRGTSQH
ncbi:MAG: SBBP repeat-containing protein [Syntrophales bacterium]|jgi:hypothetical protein|nr:SBBP repeat-containing protein [Syntrophales bacterium]